jgi:Ca2+-binding RTX toxin-like protein
MSGFASISGSDADDLVVGTNFREQISGLGGNDTLIGLGGDDTLLGGDGNDSLLGGSGEDLLMGGAGNDLIVGGFGADLLVGGAGNDTMGGGSGPDAFDFDDGFGHDLILGFQVGTDTLQIASNINATGITDPSDLLALVTADGSGNAVITLGADTITLDGITVADLTTNIVTIVQII